MYDHLFSPLTLGKTSLANRICLLPHRTNFGRGGAMNDRHIAYYRRRARGGCGLIIAGEFSIHPNDRPWEGQIALKDPANAGPLARLAGAVHEFDTRLFASLIHHGFQSSGHITRQCTWGPSAVADIEFGETCKPMEPEDMAELRKAFIDAALLFQKAGFDGIEIDMGPTSLLRQFLSPISNHREDEYGGSLENRMRLPMQIVEDVSRAVGEKMTLGVNLCADEMFWGGITPEISVPVAQALEQTSGIDYINVAVGTYYNLHMVLPSRHVSDGFTLDAVTAIKAQVGLPVIAEHQIGLPDMAESLIAEGKADAVGAVRPLISDPDLPRKAREGTPEDIRHCVKDNKGCVARVNQAKALGCIQNPEVGRESLTGSPGLSPAKQVKKVMVIGAGPAGLEAARTAAERGHKVTVWEREGQAGGQVNLIGMRPGRESVPAVVQHLKHMLDKLEVPVHTGVEMTFDKVLAEAPDAVIVATGSRPVPRPFPGDYGPPAVITGHDALKETYPLGEKILFIDEDGGHHAMATAELLVARGKKVDLLTSDLFIGIELAPRGELYLGRQRLLQQGVTFITDMEVNEIRGKKVTVRDIYTNETVTYDNYDTIVLDVGNRACDELYKALKGHIKEIYRTGDCVAPRGIDMAIIEGRHAGELL